MAKDPKKSALIDIGYLGALSLILITLKLTGDIAWSWWLVLLPIWIIPAMLAAVVVCAIAYFGSRKAVRKMLSKKKEHEENND